MTAGGRVAGGADVAVGGVAGAEVRPAVEGVPTRQGGAAGRAVRQRTTAFLFQPNQSNHNLFSRIFPGLCDFSRRFRIELIVKRVFLRHGGPHLSVVQIGCRLENVARYVHRPKIGLQ